MNFQESSETNFRCERKFTTDKISAKAIESLLTSNHFFFREIFSKRTVNSMYLDTANLDLYRQHDQGVLARKKVRIRWYGSVFGQISLPVLEIKSKKNIFGEKKQFPLTPIDFSRGFNLKSIGNLLQTSELPAAIRHTVSFLRPTLLSSYQRSYFLSADKRFRITVDDNLRFKNLCQGGFITNTRMTDESTLTVIELKYDLADEEKAWSIANQFRFPLVSNSKYCSGIRRHLI
jgi:SPX domain protein involved in polyphosphate accumulation